MATRLDKGTTLGRRFRIDELIGNGGMGSVYAAYDLEQRFKVAVKVLDARLARNTEFRERFVAESRHASQIPHPHILPVLAHGEDGEHHYLAMRLVETDLGAMIARGGPLEPTRALNIADQVAWALDTAHAAGLVHRDVKPENVLVTPRRNPDEPDQAFLSDFGIAKLDSADPGWTRRGAFIGTASYASPEQARGEALDGRSDQYSLACVVFEALTGRPPFAGASAEEVLGAHRHSDRPKASDARDGLPAGLDAVLQRGMAADSSQRYPSCRELVARARAAARDATTAPDAPPPTVARETPPRTVVDGDQAPTAPPRRAPRPAPRPPSAPRRSWASRHPLGVAVAALVALVSAGAVAAALLAGDGGRAGGDDVVGPGGPAQDAVIETVEAYAAAEGEQEVCATLSQERSDGCEDDFVNAQPTEYEISRVAVADDAATVDAVQAEFNDPIEFDLILEGERWKIDEVESFGWKDAEDVAVATPVQRWAQADPDACPELVTERLAGTGQCQNVPPEPLTWDVTQVNVFNNSASVTVQSGPSETESIDLVEFAGQWRIDEFN